MSLSTDSRLGEDDRIAQRLPVPIAPAWIGFLVFFAELIAIVAVSVGAGGAYQHWVLGEPIDLQSLSGIGVIAFLYYGIFSSYRGNYSFSNLASPSNALGEVTIVWAT